jgi:hypothetical protein
VDHVDAGHHLEQFARQMAQIPGPTGSHVDLAGICFGIGDEFRHCLRRRRRTSQHDKGADEANSCGSFNSVSSQLMPAR